MMTDPATQAITRFIGLFELLVDEARMRQELTKFQWTQPGTTPDDPIGTVEVRIGSLHVPEGFDPGLAYRPVAPVIGKLVPDPEYGDVPIPAPMPQPDLPRIEIEVQSPGAAAPSAVRPDPVPPSPDSVVVVNVQLIAMDDNDLVLSGLNADFEGVTTLTAVLELAAQVAAQLQGFEVPPMPDGTDWAQPVADFIATLSLDPTAEAQTEGAVIHRLEGPGTAGIRIDGSSATRIEDWKDLLPVFLRRDAPPDAPNAGDEGPTAFDSDDDALSVHDGETVIRTSSGVEGKARLERPDAHDISRDFKDHDGPTDAPDGNSVVTGANSAINEASLGSAWIDAPVIVVGGNLTRLDAISQVNLLVEHDRLNGVAVEGRSVGHNVAEIVTTSSGPVATGDGDAAPGSVTLFRLDADLVQINWVKQFTFITDFDRVELSLSASHTRLGTGENEALNSSLINEIGYSFDVIFVAGDMTDATIISQRNVLLDSDEVTGSGIAMSGDAGAAMADNLLYNKASITKTGIDSAEQMTDSFAKAASDLAKGIDKVAKEVVEDALFAGQAALRALQIDGSLTKINIFEQSNIVGDADQIQIEMARLRDAFEAEVKMVTGSNALINLASVTEVGVDSTILTAGKVYDHALLHQAEFFDTGAVPDGVKMTGLTNEAVAAFLSDDIGAVLDTADEIAPTINHDNAANLDVMQSMLT